MTWLRNPSNKRATKRSTIAVGMQSGAWRGFYLPSVKMIVVFFADSVRRSGADAETFIINFTIVSKTLLIYTLTYSFNDRISYRHKLKSICNLILLSLATNCRRSMLRLFRKSVKCFMLRFIAVSVVEVYGSRRRWRCIRKTASAVRAAVVRRTLLASRLLSSDCLPAWSDLPTICSTYSNVLFLRLAGFISISQSSSWLRRDGCIILSKLHYPSSI